jgi:uncharacterized phage protein gp47/JayE
MPTYGVTPEGFVRPSLQEILALIEADQRAEISQTLDLSTESVIGQNNGIYARQISLAWEALEAIHNGTDPDRAEDDQLTSISKLTGTERRGESKSIAEGVAVTLEPGTTLIAGTHFAHVNGKPDVRFTPREDFTAGGGATAVYYFDFEAENAGPVQAPANTLNVIATPVVGWIDVNNEVDADPLGRLTDDNPTLRLRREAALARSGSSSADAIRADVLAVTNVVSVQVFENWTDATDDQGLPAKSFEVVLFGDTADDDAIAQAIWNSKPGGIQPYGTTGDSGTATDANGDPHTMPFSRATEVPIYLEFDITKRDGYASLETTVAEAMDAALGTGVDVEFYDVLLSTQGLGALVRAVRMGTSVSPTTDDTIEIGNRQIARFDTSRIVVNE